MVNFRSELEIIKKSQMQSRNKQTVTRNEMMLLARLLSRLDTTRMKAQNLNQRTEKMAQRFRGSTGGSYIGPEFGC